MSSSGVASGVSAGGVLDLDVVGALHNGLRVREDAGDSSSELGAALRVAVLDALAAGPRFDPLPNIDLAVAAFPILIVLVQNDTGSVLILGSVALAIIAVSGARNTWVIGLLVGAVVSILLAIQLGLLKDRVLVQ